MNNIKTISAFKAIKYGFSKSIHEVSLVLGSLVLLPLVSLGVLLIGLGATVVFFKIMPGLVTNYAHHYVHLGYAAAVLLLYAYLSLIGGMYLGLYRIYLDICRKRASKVSRIFSCFRYVPSFVGAYLCYIVVVMLGLVFFIVPGIIFAVRFRLYVFFILEKKLGPIKSLISSYRATKGRFWSLFAIWLLQWLGYVSVILFPVFGIAYARFYCELIRQ